MANLSNSIWSEIRTEYIDDNAVLHIDGYETPDPNEQGYTLGYFIKGQFYVVDHRIYQDPYGRSVIKELESEYKTNPENFE